MRAMPSQWLIRGWGGTKTSIWFVEGPFARSGSPSALTTTLVARDAERRRAGIFEADAFLEEPAFVLAFAEANAAEEMHRIATPLAAMVVLPTEKPDALSKVERNLPGSRRRSTGRARRDKKVDRTGHHIANSRQIV